MNFPLLSLGMMVSGRSPWFLKQEAQHTVAHTNLREAVQTVLKATHSLTLPSYKTGNMPAAQGPLPTQSSGP